MSWTWEPDTFAAFWYDDGNDRMPSPLRYRSRFPTREGYEEHCAAVRARYSGEERERIELLKHTVSSCDMRVEIFFGSVAHRGGDGRTRKDLRIVGARNYSYAAVLSQTAFGEDYGDIRAQLIRADQLPQALTAAIPPCAPGKEPRATFDVQDLKPAADSGYFVDNARNSARERFDRLARRPADGGGNAILRLGNFHAPHSRFRAMQWYDITGDGRYLEQRNRTHLEVRPWNAQDVTKAFSSWIEDGVRVLREQEEDSYF
ncbi:ESX secretion-associated protein EspG [Nocardia cyriacigeorgica]|uniref:ESX secretion-associated protein EspG n=1 Tax=Nocardia cyriacigeorgica TaxID=135487 RepID=A0A6P1CU93_9NOCA|nr:ESX secretion-associated protein EspG [Nocardia cyriacigeorgica]MBF6425655.1 ESX secretion-associated protein EspG [Nocardia cyriacigeorgica]NEW36120.1 ESX secretion-associated protein EspG [Nocardia cyriacigeorgica]